jgi:hypothetical protein
MKRIALFASLILLLAACSAPTPTPAPVEPTQAVATQAAPASPVPTEAPTEMAAPLPLFTPEPTLIQILSPLDGAVVNTPQVEIVGTAPIGAVVSVDDAILIVGSDGQFKITVTLVEGPNVIEIIASEASGNQGYALLGIFYEP